MRCVDWSTLYCTSAASSILFLTFLCNKTDLNFFIYNHYLQMYPFTLCMQKAFKIMLPQSITVMKIPSVVRKSNLAFQEAKLSTLSFKRWIVQMSRKYFWKLSLNSIKIFLKCFFLPKEKSRVETKCSGDAATKHVKCLFWYFCNVPFAKWNYVFIFEHFNCSHTLQNQTRQLHILKYIAL